MSSDAGFRLKSRSYEVGVGGPINRCIKYYWGFKKSKWDFIIYCNRLNFNLDNLQILNFNDIRNICYLKI